MSDMSGLFSRATAGSEGAFMAMRSTPPGHFARDMRFSRGLAAILPEAEPEEVEGPDLLAIARAEGEAAGYARARAEAAAEARAADAARAAFATAFAALDAEMAEGLRHRLVETVAALCEATLQPLALDRKALAARVGRAVAMLDQADRDRVVHLNPGDLEIVKAQLPATWNFAADPGLLPGALRIESRDGGIEDGPETWRRAIAEALEGC